MLKNSIVRIVLVVVLVIILYYLVITLGRSNARAAELSDPAAVASIEVPVTGSARDLR